MKNQYAVHVTDARGWDDSCPTYEGVFFGSVAARAGRYVHPAEPEAMDAGIGGVGFVIVTGYREACKLRDSLDCSGDWIDPHTDREDHPIYAVQRLCLVSRLIFLAQLKNS